MKYIRINHISVSTFLILAVFSLVAMAVDEDSGTLSERGILNWLQYQKIQLSDDVYEIYIQDTALQPADLEVSLKNRSVHGTLIFENKDKTGHRIVFEQHIGNDLQYNLSSPVIGPGERWAVDILQDGIYPFYCTLHPEKMKGTLQVWYEENNIW